MFPIGEAHFKTYCEKYQLPYSDYRDMVYKSHGHAQQYMKIVIKELKKPASKSHFYMVTFTLKPDAVQNADTARAFIRGTAERKALGIIECHIVEELTKAGVPHWHMAIATDRPLARNRFQYYEKKFGSIDLSVTKNKTLTEALNYMSKAGETEQLV